MNAFQASALLFQATTTNNSCAWTGPCWQGVTWTQQWSWHRYSVSPFHDGRERRFPSRECCRIFKFCALQKKLSTDTSLPLADGNAESDHHLVGNHPMVPRNLTKLRIRGERQFRIHKKIQDRSQYEVTFSIELQMLEKLMRQLPELPLRSTRLSLGSAGSMLSSFCLSEFSNLADINRQNISIAMMDLFKSRAHTKIMTLVLTAAVPMLRWIAHVDYRNLSEIWKIMFEIQSAFNFSLNL